MKLLYITNGVRGPGGLERVLSIKASFFVEEYNYDVHILTLNELDNDLFYDFSGKIKYHNIIVKGKALQYLLKYRKGIREVIQEVNPDIISVCDDGLKGLLFPFLIDRNCPIIYERHVSKKIALNFKKNRIKNKLFFITNFLMNLGGSRYDKFVVLTKGNKEEWPLNNLKVIPNPLPFSSNISADLNSKKIISVGKISEQKGYMFLVKACEEVFEKHPDWSLNIYGSKGGDYSDVIKKIDNLGLSNNFILNEPVKNIQEKYLDSSIYVMSSRYEGFGMVLIEAMSFGVPCVSFDCPHGPGDIISNEIDGFLVENGNIEKLTKSILILIEDKERRKLMGAEARENVKRYSVEKIMGVWDELFKGLAQ